MSGSASASGQSREWLARARQDLEAASSLLPNKDYAEVVAGLIQQAVEKYLKGYLLALGWELVKTHDIEILLSEAAKHNREFAGFLDFGRALSAVYIQSKYPPGLPITFSTKELSEMLEQARELIAKIIKETG